MLQQPDGLVYGLAGGQVTREVTGEAWVTTPRVPGVDVLLRGPGRGGSVLLLLREDSLLLGDESRLVVAQRGGGWDDIL